MKPAEAEFLIESNTHSFIIKIWLEETLPEAKQALWRGHITHVPDGQRSYLKDLDDIPAFLAPYLQQMGVALPRRWRLRAWLRQRGLL